LRHYRIMRLPVIITLTLGLAAPAFAGDATPRPRPQSQPQPQSQVRQKPVSDMEKLLRELRDLDSSQEMEGDHAVGELLC